VAALLGILASLPSVALETPWYFLQVVLSKKCLVEGFVSGRPMPFERLVFRIFGKSLSI